MTAPLRATLATVTADVVGLRCRPFMGAGLRCRPLTGAGLRCRPLMSARSDRSTRRAKREIHAFQLTNLILAQYRETSSDRLEPKADNVIPFL